MPVLASALLALAGAQATRASWVEDRFELHAVSSRPDMVSGGDVLLELSAPNGLEWTARLDGRDITLLFQRVSDSQRLLALLKRLEVGKHVVEIHADGQIRARLEILNHPANGPLFSGRQSKPFICETVANGLGPAIDDSCSARTIVQYYYKSTAPAKPFSREAMIEALNTPPGHLAPGFKVHDSSSPMPADVADTVTSDGRRVKFMVRREIGTINRAVYDIQFLHKPGEPLPTPWTAPMAGWNGRLVYVFGGGRGGGFRQGLLRTVGPTQEPLLAQGFAVATSTLNIFDNNGNDRVSAETLSAVKEYFTESFGIPVHTIGWGGSGGAMQMYLIAQNYPGLLDGMIATVSFPDMTSTAQSIMDCSLLDNAFQTTEAGWSDEQKTAVTGFATWRTCKGWMSPMLSPSTFCDSVMPKELIYDAAHRPRGVRCDFYEHGISVFGRDPRTGFARRPLDNVGVQYGLTAFQRGTIDTEQFVSLNEHIGGFDVDGQIVSRRTSADAETLHMAYERGLLLTGGGGLNQIPIIDWRPYSDDIADVHDRFRSFVTRARLINAHVNADHQAILVDPRPELSVLMTNNRWTDPDARFAERERDLVAQMNRWLGDIAADTTPDGVSEKISRNKPEALADGCQTTSGERIVEPARYDSSGRCNELYPPHADPRIAAGGPLAGDVLKCQLRPIDWSKYRRPLTAGQRARLEAAFPNGVCDYRLPGVGQHPTTQTWLRF